MQIPDDERLSLSLKVRQLPLSLRFPSRAALPEPEGSPWADAVRVWRKFNLPFWKHIAREPGSALSRSQTRETSRSERSSIHFQLRSRNKALQMYPRRLKRERERGRCKHTSTFAHANATTVRAFNRYNGESADRRIKLQSRDSVGCYRVYIERERASERAYV